MDHEYVPQVFNVSTNSALLSEVKNVCYFNSFAAKSTQIPMNFNKDFSKKARSSWKLSWVEVAYNMNERLVIFSISNDIFNSF